MTEFFVLLAGFIRALPDLIQLFLVLQKRIKEAELDHHVAQDVKTIHEAFNAKDAEKLNSLFASPK